MNHVMPVTNMALITFGNVRFQFYINTSNMQITYPLMVIFLVMAEIKACFQFARIHTNLTGAYGFLAGGYYSLATAMVFGSTASSSS